MSAPAVALLLLAVSARALEPRLAAVPDPEPGDAPGLTLSWGPGRPVCGRATFDRAKAATGGYVFVTDAGEPGDEDAVRLSGAVVARRGGLTSRAAVFARRHGVPAVALGRGVWDPAGPSLTIEEPTFGPPVVEGGVAVRAAGVPSARTLREGEAACVDAAAGRVLFPPPEEAESRVAAAEAARAYDGLRDAGALERWLSGAPDAARAAALMAELAPRALEGGAPVDDLVRLDRAARAAAGPGGVGAVARAETRAWGRAVRATRAALSTCAAAASEAPGADVADRLAEEARAAASRAAAGGRALGLPDGGLGALARACAAAAAARRRAVPARAPSLDEAARAAGAEQPEAVEVGPEAWRAFVAENGLAEFLIETSGDASLGLRRKSERLRERVLAGRLDPASEAGRALAAAAASCPCVVSGADASLPAPDARSALAAARAVWAASWEPGPLGARLRAGRATEVDGRLRIERSAAAEVSGLVFSRDPSSARRGRALVEAAPGGLEGLLGGGAPADRYDLDAASGRAREIVPAGPRPILTPERLRRLARLARALDAWRGAAVEAAFSFSGGKLLVLHVRPLEPPRPLEPLSDPLGPRPSAEVLSVKSVR
jgi:hypothetical protein